MYNLIKDDGRIVADMTFANRLLKVLSNLEPEDDYEKEELDYLLNIAKALLRRQIKFCNDEAELNYLRHEQPEFFIKKLELIKIKPNQ